MKKKTTVPKAETEQQTPPSEPEQPTPPEEPTSPEPEQPKEPEEQEDEVQEPTVVPDPVHPATFSLGDYTTFGNFARLLKGVVEEATLLIDQAGVHISHMDQQHVCLVDIELPSDGIPVFSYDSNEPSRVAFRVVDLVKLIPLVSKIDDVVVSILDRDNATVTLKGNRNRTFVTHLIEPSALVPIPKVTLTQKMTFVRSTFLQVLHDANAVSDALTITADRQFVRFTAKSDEGAYEQVFEAGKDIELIQLLATGPFSITYSTSYLLGALDEKILKDVGAVTLNMDNKAPLCAEVSLSSLFPRAKVHFWLAPRVQSEPPKPEDMKPAEPDEGPVNDEEPQEGAAADEPVETQGSEDGKPIEVPVPAES